VFLIVCLQLGFEVQPSPTILTCVVEPYNALLTTHGLLDYTEISVLLGNEAMHEICQKHLDIKRSSYDALSRLIVKAVSSMTAPLHFEGELDVDMNEFQTNLEPFPRLHFVITTMAPIMTERKETTNNEMRPITELCFSAQRFFAKITDCDAEEHKYMADSGNYRGLVKAKEAYATAQWLKINKQVTLVEWMPTDFKVRLNEVPAARVGDDRQ
jgi:tubulin alpha